VRRRDESGLVTLQQLLSSPVQFAILFTILQAGLSFYGSIVCRFAADAAIDAATTVDGTEAAGRDAAEQRLAAFDSRVFLGRPSVVVKRTNATAEVEIRGSVYHVLPRVFDTSGASIVQSVQRFRPPDEP
jgi:hypothetical protein